MGDDLLDRGLAPFHRAFHPAGTFGGGGPGGGTKSDMVSFYVITLDVEEC